MSYIAYMDETGDHSLELIDKDFPIFALGMLVCDKNYYCRTIIPVFYEFKMKYFGYEGIILHSRDIRKAQGNFGFLTDPAVRETFMQDLNLMMRDFQYDIIVSVIKKQEHKERYVNAMNPYDLAMMFCLERLLSFLKHHDQKEIDLVAESRGKKEDADLELSFLKTISQGTSYISSDEFKKVSFKLHFVPKRGNIVGTQMMDLAAYPIARNVLHPGKPSAAYEIVRKKIFWKKGCLAGIKVFP